MLVNNRFLERKWTPDSRVGWLYGGVMPERECFDATRKKSLTPHVSTRSVHLAMPDWSNVELVERASLGASAPSGMGTSQSGGVEITIAPLAILLPVGILGLGLLLIGPGCGPPN
jgi:hypothetical protein